MSKHRTQQVSALLQETISSILLTGTTDERLHRVTVTGVVTSKDLRYARVYFTVLGGDKERAETIAALDHAGGFLRHQLGTLIRLRYVPELRFTYDDATERAARIAELLRGADMGPAETGVEP